MNTQQLKCFLCVADKLSFTKASQELFITVPTVTHHIQNLEEELNCRLFHRNRKMVQLTEEGKRFYTDALDIMDRMVLSKSHLQNEKAYSEILRIGFTSENEVQNQRFFFQALHNENQKIVPKVKVDTYDRLVEYISSGFLDGAFMTKDMIHGYSQFQFKKIKEIHTMVVGVDHEVQWKEIENLPLIHLHHRNIPYTYEDFVQQKLDAHEKKNLDMIVDSAQIVETMALSNYGIGILPESYVCSEKAYRLKESRKIAYGFVYLKGSRKKITSVFNALKHIL